MLERVDSQETLQYRTMNCQAMKIENIPLDEVESIVNNMKQETVFISQVKRFGTIEIMLEKRETAHNISYKTSRRRSGGSSHYIKEDVVSSIRVGALVPDV